MKIESGFNGLPKGVGGRGIDGNLYLVMTVSLIFSNGRRDEQGKKYQGRSPSLC